MARARPVPLDCETPFGEVAARAIEVRADELLSFAAAAREPGNVRAIHDMRVASRRLRAVLEVFEPALPRKRRRAALRDVKRLADALGARRDPDVQIEALERVAASAPAAARPGVESVVAELRARQRAGDEQVAAALERFARGDLPDRLRGLAASARERAQRAAS